MFTIVTTNETGQFALQTALLREDAERMAMQARERLGCSGDLIAVLSPGGAPMWCEKRTRDGWLDVTDRMLANIARLVR